MRKEETMAQKKKIKNPVILFASVERKQHDALRALSFKSHRSIAELTRDAIEKYIAQKPTHAETHT